MTKRDDPICCVKLCFKPAFYSERDKLYCDKHGLALHSLRPPPARAAEGYVHTCGHCNAARAHIDQRRQAQIEKKEAAHA